MSWNLTKQNRLPTPTRPTPAKRWTSCRTIRQLSPSCKTLTRTAALHPADINCGITAERINGFARNGHFRNIFTQGLHASMKALRPTDAMCHITSATGIYVFNSVRQIPSRTHFRPCRQQKDRHETEEQSRVYSPTKHYKQILKILWV